eukprot:gene36283-44759_t
MSAYATVELLEKHLSTRSYITGYSLSADDKKELAALKAFPTKATSPNAWRWATHIVALTGAQVAAGAAVAAPAAKSSSAPAKKAAADDEIDDMFGDEDEAEELNDEGENKAEAAATAARQARMENALKLKNEKDAKDGKVKVEKAKPVEKSLVVLEVKPWEADTDLEKVWHLIKEYKQEGLVWGESFKLEPVAYGIMKLVMTCTIVDSLVLLDDVTENIEAIDQFVQSVNIASMNKI